MHVLLINILASDCLQCCPAWLYLQVLYFLLFAKSTFDRIDIPEFMAILLI